MKQFLTIRYYKMKYKSLVILAFFIILISCDHSKYGDTLNHDNLYAWCIVPFDSLKRSPEQRINMLKELGISKYAYDWRDENLSEMADELRLAKENNIEVIGVWMWFNSKRDSLKGLSAANEKVFSIIEEVGYTGQIWVSFNQNFFDNLTDDEAVNKGAKMIEKISKRASALNCKIGLYNHGDWFGEPENQIKIIKALPNEDLGLVYNFHHAHEQIDTFADFVPNMTPYLWSVNLNGMRKEGPKILTIGEGDYEKQMIDILIENGYKGEFGILGHVDEADVELILKANLIGLEKINS